VVQHVGDGTSRMGKSRRASKKRTLSASTDERNTSPRRAARAERSSSTKTSRAVIATAQARGFLWGKRTS
jgi:hypothetical protein